MAKKTDIEYIRYYSEGSAARKLEPVYRPARRSAPKYAAPEKPVRKILVDPVAVASIAVAAVLLVLMLVGFSKLNGVMAETARMESYIQQLESENAVLTDNFHAGYDPEEVRKAALSLGMVPREKLQHHIIDVVVEEPVQEQTLWEQIVSFFTGPLA